MIENEMRHVNCPQCKKKIPYSIQNLFRPFCSERCKTIDLGAWSEEKFRIPVNHSEVETLNEPGLPDTEEE